jgi:hypothetical protein
MGYTQTSSETSHIGELSGGLFAGDHAPEGVFQSLKGMMLTPPELSFDIQDHNDGPDRLNQEEAKVEWRTHGPVESGTFSPDALTRGTDKHMPK